jgi:DNA-binding Lrp family transcriptional regulator
MVQILVLINAEKVSVLEVVKKLGKMPGVREAFPTFGRFDVVAFCNVEKRDEVGAFVKTVAGLEGVLRTETLVEL